MILGVDPNGNPIEIQCDELGHTKTTLVGSLTKGPDGNYFVIDGTDCKGKAASKPLASDYPFYTYWSVDTDPHANSIEVSDGTNWTVI